MKLKKTLIHLLILASFLSVSSTKAAQISHFKDVASNDQYLEAIEYVYQQGIVSGHPDGTFRPYDKITRAAFTKIIIEAAFPNQAIGQDCFPDVKNEWFAPYICFAKQNNIIGGYPNGTFNPGGSVNFAEAAKIVVNAFGYEVPPNKWTVWYAPYIDVLANRNAIPSTVPDNNQLITRGDMTMLIYLLQKDQTLPATTKAPTATTNREQNTITTQQPVPDPAPAIPYIANANYHNIKFFIDPGVTNGRSTADLSKRLEKYVHDMNYILAKSTKRQLSFDPNDNVIIQEEKPYSDWYTGRLPTNNVDVIIWIQERQELQSPPSRLYGENGEIVIVGLMIDDIYDRDEILGESDSRFYIYWQTITTMLHEFAHGFGVGSGEYYTFSRITDNTNIEPNANADVLMPNDVFWGERKSYLNDPMTFSRILGTIHNNPQNNNEVLNAFEFNDLSSAVIDLNLRNNEDMFSQLPNMDNINLTAIDSDNKTPIPGTNYKIWKININNSYSVENILDTLSTNGAVSFEWGEHNRFNIQGNLVLIKIYADGYEPAVKYLTIFDAQKEKVVFGKDTWSVNIEMTRSD